MKKYLYYIFITVFISLVFGIIHFIFIGVDERIVKSSDFVSFLTGAEIVRNGDIKKIYELEEQRKFQRRLADFEDENRILPFRNPPIFAFLFLPFLNFSTYFSYKIFAIINVLLLVFLSFLISKYLGNREKIFLCLIPVSFFPCLITILIGQFSFFLFLVVFVIYLFLKSQKLILAGFLSGLLLIKLQFIFLIPFLIIMSSKKEKFLIGFFVGSFIFLFLNLYLVSPRGILEYFSFLSQTETEQFGSRGYQMFNLLGILSSFFEIKTKDFFVFSSFFYLFFLFLFLMKSKKLDLEYNFSCAIILFLFFSLHTLSHDLVLLLIPIFVFLKKKLNFFALCLLFIPWVYLLGKVYLSPFVLLFTALYLLLKESKHEVIPALV